VWDLFFYCSTLGIILCYKFPDKIQSIKGMFMISNFSTFLFIPLSAFRKIVYTNLNKRFKTIVVVFVTRTFRGDGMSHVKILKSRMEIVLQATIMINMCQDQLKRNFDVDRCLLLFLGVFVSTLERLRERLLSGELLWIKYSVPPDSTKRLSVFQRGRTRNEPSKCLPTLHANKTFCPNAILKELKTLDDVTNTSQT